MFIRKNKVSILDRKWLPIKSNLKLRSIPRIREYIYFDNSYYEVINIVHSLEVNQDIFIIVNEISSKSEDNEKVD